jgi:hypothetical protein
MNDKHTSARRMPKILLGLGILIVAAVVAFVTMPVWLQKLPHGDRALIAFERSQRLMRWSLGFPMPGEPDLARLPERLAEAGVKEGSPILVRIF